MNFGKKKFFAFAIALVIMFGVFTTFPAFQQEAQASTIVEQKLQEYMAAHPVGGAAYNCMTFAKEVFKYVFGYDAAGIDYHGNSRSDCSLSITDRLGDTSCSEVSGATSGNVTVENLKALFAEAQPGDIIEAMTPSHGKHTMVLISADDSGITVYHGNWNGKIAYTTFSYEKFAGKWSHTVTIYHATNYDQIANTLNASPVNSAVSLAGNDVFPRTYDIDGVSYYSVRDIASLLKDTPVEFDLSGTNGLSINVGGNFASDSAVTALTDSSKKAATLKQTTINVNGKEVSTSYYEIDGNVYFPIRQLAHYVGFDVDWNTTEKCVQISFVNQLIDDIANVNNDVLDMGDMASLM